MLVDFSLKFLIVPFIIVVLPVIILSGFIMYYMDPDDFKNPSSDKGDSKDPSSSKDGETEGRD